MTSVQHVVAPRALAHQDQLVRIDILMFTQFVRLHMGHSGSDPAEFLGQHPLLHVLEVDAFTSEVHAGVHTLFAAVQVGMTGADAAEAARTHSAFVESRAVVIACTGFFCVPENGCVQWNTESEQKVTFQSVSTAHVGLAVLCSDGFSVDQLDEEVDDRSVVPLGNGPVDARSKCTAQQTNEYCRC